MIVSGSFAKDINRNGTEISVYDSIESDTIINKQPISVEAFDLDILAPSTGIQFFKDGIVYLGSSKSDKKMIPDHISFGKVNTYYAVLKEKGLENPSVFSPSNYFTYPSEAVTFNIDYTTLYFAKYSKNDGVEKIFEAKFSPGAGNPGDWAVDENPMSFCSGKAVYTHPALSADGKLLIFASNRPGSIGGMDLYASLEKNGIWSEPVNLGNAVNSTSNELYPYLDPENNLFFSSDNLQGFGGFDIYVCKFKSNTWEKPINLSTPVNTRFDDLAFKIDRKGGKSAFYTVKQNTDIRSLQLYKVILNLTQTDTLLSLSQFYTRRDISQMVILALEPPVQATDKISEVSTRSTGSKDNVVYRVQFVTSFNPKTRSQITLNSKEYNIFEYLYSGAYRLCIGEFSTLSQAKELQTILINNDYPKAVIVAFQNNVLSLDPELMKDLEVTKPIAETEKTVIKKPAEEIKSADIKIDTIKKQLSEPETKKTIPVKPAVTQPKATEVSNQGLVYRIQFASNTVSKGSFKVIIDGKSFNTFEYSYNGAFRSTVGELKTLSEAKVFQTKVRQSGYPTAFVVAFKDNIRSLDPALFK